MSVLAGLLVMGLAASARAQEARLGTPQAAGPFQVVLTTNPAPPQVGPNRFRVEVTRDGQPVPGARVTLRLTMPSHHHGGRSGNEPKIEIRLVADVGGYSGAARLNNVGPWQAHIQIKARGKKGAADYWFVTAT